MKTLTIRQPWASLIAAGVKTIETRSWSTSYRGPLAIHAGKHQPGRGELGGWCFDDRPWLDDCGWIAPIMERDSYTGEPIPEFFGNKMPLGAVVATCTLADVLPITGENREDHPAFVCPSIYDDLTLYRFQHGGDQLATVVDDITDQLPFGDFTPGRYAWLLENITPLADPVPAKGRLGLWDWDSGELDHG